MLVLATLRHVKYQSREFSPYPTFITANFFTTASHNYDYNFANAIFGLFILLVRSLAKNLANAIFGYVIRFFPGPKSRIRQEPSIGLMFLVKFFS